MAAFSNTSFSTSAFSDQSFSFASTPPPVIVVIDKHDGTEREVKQFRERQERLRAQIRFAIEGKPAPVAVEQAVNEVLMHSQADRQIKVDKIYGDVLALLEMQAIEEDDEDVLLLI